MSRQNIGTFVKAGAVGVIATVAGLGIVTLTRATMLFLGATAPRSFQAPQNDHLTSLRITPLPVVITSDRIGCS